jgi:hypothetical protein
MRLLPANQQSVGGRVTSGRVKRLLLALSLWVAAGCGDPTREVAASQPAEAASQPAESEVVAAKRKGRAATRARKIELDDADAHHAMARIGGDGALRVECVRGREAAQRRMAPAASEGSE